MSLIKKIFLILAVIIAGVTTLVIVLFRATSELPATADRFFKAIADGRVTEAYHLTSKGFQQTVPRTELLRYGHDVSLDEYQSSSWDSRSIHNDSGTIEGHVTFRSGITVPVAVEFVREEGVWKVHHLKNLQRSMYVSSDQGRSLLSSTVQDFSRALTTQDFSTFYLKLSPAWQVSTSQDELLDRFRPLADKDLSGLLSDQSITLIENPRLDENGLLILKGEARDVPQAGQKTEFEAKYYDDGSGWKLFGFYAEVK